MAEPFEQSALVRQSSEAFSEEYEKAYVNGFVKGFIKGFEEGWNESKKKSLERIEKSYQQGSITLAMKEEMDQLLNEPIDQQDLMKSLVHSLIKKGIKESLIISSTGISQEQFEKIKQQISNQSLLQQSWQHRRGFNIEKS